jgi:hypothetical protein
MFTGCASFPKDSKTIKKPVITNISDINGTYNIAHNEYALINDSTKIVNSSKATLSSYPTFFDEFNNGIFVKQLKIDSIQNYSFSLKILNSKRIEVSYLKNDTVVRQQTMRYILKPNGYLYIKHRNFKIIGIPYILGGFLKKRKRLTLNANNDLIFETVETVSAGMFLLKVVPYLKTYYAKNYKRVEQM